MSNLPSHIAAFPTPTPQISQSLSPEQLADHRTQIGFDVEVVLSGYWQTEMCPKLRAAVLTDWANELEDWPLEQVSWGLREWRRNNPRRKPNPGDILRVLKDRRGRAAAAKVAAITKPAEPERKVVDDETRASQQARLQQVLSGFCQRAAQSDAGRVGA